MKRMHSLRYRRLRRGVQTLEAIIVIPVLVLLLVAMVQFTSLSAVQQTVESAADEAAREVAKAEVRGGVFVTDAPLIATDVVNEILGIHGLTVSNVADSGVRIFIEDENNDDGDVDGNVSLSVGDPNLVRTNAPVVGVSDDEVRITLIVSFDPAAPNPDPVPDVLSYVGLTFQGSQYEIVTTAPKE